MNTEKFNLAEQLGTSIAMGDILGSQQLDEILMPLIIEKGSDNIWLIDTHKCLIEYKFVAGFLGPLVEDYCSRLPKNVVIVLLLKRIEDRSQVFRGLAWEEGLKWRTGSDNVVNEDEILRLIIKKKRYLTILNSKGNYEYIGTTNNKQLELLDYLEEREEAILDDIREHFGWNSSTVNSTLDDLCQRRHIIRIDSGSKKEHRYKSIKQSII